MNNVLDRIAELRARFEPAAARTAAGATASSTSSAGGAGFSSVLASAQTTPAGRASDPTSAAMAALTDALSARTGGSGVDTTSFASLSRLLQASTTKSTAGTGNAAPGAVPAAYGDYAASIDQVAIDEGVPASLLGALVWSESSFNPQAVSPAGARGLTQLMPATAAGLGVDIDDPGDNLRGGARYLRQMLDRFGSPELALAAYNAGPNAVSRANGIPNYPETQNYVTKVMARAAALAGATA